MPLCSAPSRPRPYAPPPRSAALRALTAPALSDESLLRDGRVLCVQGSGRFDSIQHLIVGYPVLPMAKRTSHRFGGAWTDDKLKVLEGYLSAYTTALKNTSLRKGYIDAFAGKGRFVFCESDGSMLNEKRSVITLTTRRVVRS